MKEKIKAASQSKLRIRLLHLLMFLALLFLDQGSKYLAKTNLQGQGKKMVVPKLLSFTYLENTGAVWGIFQGRTTFLIITTVVAFFLILFFYFKLPMDKKNLPLRLIFVFVAAGALGNIIDRIRYAYVVDFINFEFIDFPVFNVADIYITVSAFVVLILALFFYKEEDLTKADEDGKAQEKTDGEDKEQ